MYISNFKKNNSRDRESNPGLCIENEFPNPCTTHIVQLQIDMMEKCILSNLTLMLSEVIIDQNQGKKFTFHDIPFELPANQHSRFDPPGLDWLF